METSIAITTVKKELRLQEWAAQIEAQQQSGLTVRSWCEQNGISAKTYYYRLRKVRENCLGDPEQSAGRSFAPDHQGSFLLLFAETLLIGKSSN